MKSLWIDSANREEKEVLNQDIVAEVCIIGGGLVGISTAYYLSKNGIKPVILEKGRICEQTTGNSTAKVTSQHDLFYKYLIDSQGEKFAKKYYEANEKAIDKIEKVIKSENIECDWERRSAYVFTQKVEEISKIKDEVGAVKSIGGNAELVENGDIPINKIAKANIEEKDKNKEQKELSEILNMKPLAAIRFPNQAQYNPYKYALKLAKIAEESGSQIYENTKVIDVEKYEDGYRIKVDNGANIQAKYVIVATKYPIINIPGFYFMKMYQSTSYAVAMEVDKEVIEDGGMYINVEIPRISFRMAKDGERKFLIVAGFDHKTGEDIKLEDAYKYLEEIGRVIAPSAKLVYKWNTEDCISLDKIPYIGEYSKLMPNVYVATGFKKWGMTTSNIAARMIKNKILGKHCEYEDIFESTRVEPIKNRKEMGNIIKQTVDTLIIEKLKLPKETIDEIRLDEGKIVDFDGKKVGVYKNGSGEIFKIKPVCAHLGCELSWNNLEKTWDCPCHGSRYDYRGNLIYGPSVKNLEEY